MAITELTNRIPAPSGVVANDWAPVERLLGAALPTAYRALVDAYGPGDFGGVLRLWSPNAETTDHAFARQSLEHMDRLGRSFAGGRAPMPMLASSPTKGALPWAAAANGVACFDTVGTPDSWKVVFVPNDGDPIAFDGDAAAFVLAVLDGKVPGFDAAAPKTFEPAR